MWNGTTSLNNSNIYQLGENVGIGTATPQNTLNVIGDGNFTGTLTIANGTASGHAVTLGQLQSSVGSVTEVDPYWSSNFTNGLSGNWNVGAFDITANNFIGAWNGSSDYYLKNNPFRFLQLNKSKSRYNIFCRKWN